MKKLDDKKIKLLVDYVGCLNDSCREAVTVAESDDELIELVNVVMSACTAVHYFLRSKNKD